MSDNLTKQQTSNHDSKIQEPSSDTDKSKDALKSVPKDDEKNHTPAANASDK